MSERNPSLQELIGSGFDYHMSNIYTSIPAVVVSVKDLSQQRLDVQPVLNMRSKDGNREEQRPPILNVPFQMPVTKKGGLTYPIETGDSVWLMFSMRGLDLWKRGNGGFQAPSSVRKFDVRDCVAIAGVYPFSQSPNSGRSNAHSTSDVVLVHNIGKGSEVEIRLKPNGDVVINSPTKVEVNCTDAEVNATDVEVNATMSTINSEVEINGATTVNGLLTYTAGLEGSGGSGAIITGGAQFIGGNITHNGTDIGDTHRHGGVMSGGSTTDTPS